MRPPYVVPESSGNSGALAQAFSAQNLTDDEARALSTFLRCPQRAERLTVLSDLEAADDISRRVDRLLRAADAYGRFPTPVDDIVAAANSSSPTTTSWMNRDPEGTRLPARPPA